MLNNTANLDTSETLVANKDLLITQRELSESTKESDS
jgi:hypothetical protein